MSHNLLFFTVGFLIFFFFTFGSQTAFHWYVFLVAFFLNFIMENSNIYKVERWNEFHDPASSAVNIWLTLFHLYSLTSPYAHIIVLKQIHTRYHIILAKILEHLSLNGKDSFLKALPHSFIIPRRWTNNSLVSSNSWYSDFPDYLINTSLKVGLWDTGSIMWSTHCWCVSSISINRSPLLFFIFSCHLFLFLAVTKATESFVS